ncbi:IS1/IS1595 family N-terminal zinc-binding domain-containing protein [Rhodopila sp.]|uniref:IS1/IS1595 family N-terminal zinc-binding domain-containing protein n=1 Tax=Rhodopila sp. TaxID=2480087 RepID=UPI003D0F0520
MSADGLNCKQCGGLDYVKSGTVRGHQRYRCHRCGCNFTDTPLRGKPPAMKALAMLLYGMGNMSFSMIGRLLGVSDVAVLKWVRAEASALPEPEVAAQVITVEADEMWHFIKKSLPSCGSGAPMTLIHAALWPGFWVGVMMQPAAACSTRSA